MDGEAPNRLLTEIKAYLRKNNECEFTIRDLEGFVEGRYTHPLAYLRGVNAHVGRRHLRGVIQFNLKALHRLGKVKRAHKGMTPIWMMT